MYSSWKVNRVKRHLIYGGHEGYLLLDIKLFQLLLFYNTVWRICGHKMLFCDVRKKHFTV